MRVLFAAVALVATASQALGQTLSCKPPAPRIDPGTGFIVAGASEQIVARGGISGRGWEWALENVKGDLDWTSGVAFQWSVTYSGSGAATLEVRKQGAIVLSLSKSTGMQTGNAIDLQVSTDDTTGPDTTVSASVATINGHAVSAAVAQAGSNQDSTKHLYLYFPEMSGGFTASGTVMLSYSRLPKGSRVDFRVRAGNVPCNNQAPTISLRAPAEGSVHQAGSTIALAAEAQDVDGTVAQVDFLDNGNVIGTATSAPFNFNWTTAAAGNHTITARATDNAGDGASADVTVFVNAAPTASLTSPTQNSVFTAPANISITAQAEDADGAISRVEFYSGATLITTLTAAPYSFVWTDVPQGNYSITARVADNNGGTVTSEAVNITVNSGVAKLHFIHVDHLNTPRLVANEIGQTVWRWDQQEPFGVNVADENPSGLGAFDIPLRLPGQYFDKETNLHHNYYRDFDPESGRYAQSDPIGLDGGLNTYAYVRSDPLRFIDPDGLEVRFICRPVGGGPGLIGFQHCFVHLTCPKERWASTLSVYAGKGYGGAGMWPRVSYKAANEGPDDPNAAGQFDEPVTPPNQCFRDPCAYEKAILRRFNSFQGGLVPYSAAGPNSNSFAAGLITGNQYGGLLPAGAPGPIAAPGINMPHPGFPN